MEALKLKQEEKESIRSFYQQREKTDQQLKQRLKKALENKEAINDEEYNQEYNYILGEDLAYIQGVRLCYLGSHWFYTDEQGMKEAINIYQNKNKNVETKRGTPYLLKSKEINNIVEKTRKRIGKENPETNSNQKNPLNNVYTLENAKIERIVSGLNSGNNLEEIASYLLEQTVSSQKIFGNSQRIYSIKFDEKHNKGYIQTNNVFFVLSKAEYILLKRYLQKKKENNQKFGITPGEITLIRKTVKKIINTKNK